MHSINGSRNTMWLLLSTVCNTKVLIETKLTVQTVIVHLNKTPGTGEVTMLIA